MSKPNTNDANILLAALTRTAGVKSHNGVVDAERIVFGERVFNLNMLQWTALFCTFLFKAHEITKPCTLLDITHKSTPSARRPLCLRAQRLDNYSTCSTTYHSSGDYQFMIPHYPLEGNTVILARHRRTSRRCRNRRFNGHPPRRPNSPSPCPRPRCRLRSSALERNRWLQCSLAGPAVEQHRWPPCSGAAGRRVRRVLSVDEWFSSAVSR